MPTSRIGKCASPRSYFAPQTHVMLVVYRGIAAPLVGADHDDAFLPTDVQAP
jgi:hypothetical protein